MKQNTNIDPLEEDSFEIIDTNAVDLSDEIENMLENKGDKPSKEFKKRVNNLIMTFNDKYGKTFRKIS